MDDATRIALAARDGDRDALADLVARTQGEVWRFCSRLGDRDAADDLTQETYLRAVRALPSFRGEASIRTWLLGIARRVCADHVRTTQRARAAHRLLPRPSAAPDPGGSLALEGLIEDLQPAVRDAFVLTQQLGCSYAEAAEVLGCPVGTVRSRVSRARERLVAALGSPPVAASAEADDQAAER